MDTSTHDFSGLFAQLGLANDVDSIRAFIESHSLPVGCHVAEADFWNIGQAAFLAEHLASDDDWAELIDALALRLSR